MCGKKMVLHCKGNDEWMDKTREDRKLSHLALAAGMTGGPCSPGWEDVHLVHQALIRSDRKDLDTGSVFLGKKLELPLIINAMTGGAEGLEKINASLARAAKENGIAMAVGSQTAGIENPGVRHTYETARRNNPDGLILANVSALVHTEYARAAVEMLQANALQLHLNGVQELLMKEGDRNFGRLEDNIARIAASVNVPVVVKEVGFGISRETAARLSRLGVQAIDVSGAGGTNFAAIELARHRKPGLEYILEWGIPTVCSVLEVRSLNLPVTLIASGGVTNSVEMMKALALGADLAGMAGSFLQTLRQDGEKALINRIIRMKEELKTLMMVTGTAAIAGIREIPLVITGFTKEWCKQRGIMPDRITSDH